MAEGKMPSNASTANSSSPAIDSVAKDSFKGGMEHGTPSVQEALGQKLTKNPVNPGSLKK